MPNRNIQHTLVLIKPDGIKKSLTGNILSRLSETRLRIIGAKIVQVSKELAERHYAHLRDKPFFNDVITYLQGGPYGEEYRRVLALVYSGDNAIEKVRKLAGETNPETADSASIRGQYGRITSKGLFENVVHCSANAPEAEAEIKLWFSPAELAGNTYPTEEKDVQERKKVWK